MNPQEQLRQHQFLALHQAQKQRKQQTAEQLRRQQTVLHFPAPATVAQPQPQNQWWLQWLVCSRLRCHHGCLARCAAACAEARGQRQRQTWPQRQTQQTEPVLPAQRM